MYGEQVRCYPVDLGSGRATSWLWGPLSLSLSGLWSGRSRLLAPAVGSLGCMLILASPGADLVILQDVSRAEAGGQTPRARPAYSDRPAS